MTHANTLSPADLVAHLRWRYAVKKFDPTRHIPDDRWNALEQALVLAPSSFGLQPWKFFDVRDQALRAKLVAASWRQSQVAEASHYLVFAMPRTLGDAGVDRYIDRCVELRGTPRTSLEGYRKVMCDFLAKPGFDLDAWMARQVYIALGQFMAAAATIGVDTCPMEGIDAAQYDAILGLEAKGYRTLVGCAAGYRAADDKLATLPKVRYSHADIIEVL